MFAEKAFRGSIDRSRTMYDSDLLLAQEVLTDLLLFERGVSAEPYNSTQVTAKRKIGRQLNKGLFLGNLPMAIEGIWPLVEAEGEVFSRRISTYHAYLISDRTKFTWGYANPRKNRLHPARKMYRRMMVAEGIIRDLSVVVNRKVASLSGQREETAAA